MKRDFDKSPNIRVNSFVIGEKVMLRVPKELKVKLGENIYGPYVIAEIYKTSAKICVIGKRSQYIIVPLERLVKIPDELRNINITAKYPKNSKLEKMQITKITISAILAREDSMRDDAVSIKDESFSTIDNDDNNDDDISDTLLTDNEEPSYISETAQSMYVITLYLGHPVFGSPLYVIITAFFAITE